MLRIWHPIPIQCLEPSQALKEFFDCITVADACAAIEHGFPTLIALHPEVKRWQGYTPALYERHMKLFGRLKEYIPLNLTWEWTEMDSGGKILYPNDSDDLIIGMWNELLHPTRSLFQFIDVKL